MCITVPQIEPTPPQAIRLCSTVPETEPTPPEATHYCAFPPSDWEGSGGTAPNWDEKQSNAFLVRAHLWPPASLQTPAAAPSAGIPKAEVAEILSQALPWDQEEFGKAEKQLPQP